MEVVFILTLAKLRPRTLCKKVAPVVGKLAILTLFNDVIVLVFFLACEGTLEPFVLVGGVIDDKIHQNANAALFCFGKQLVKVLHRAKFGLNGGVIGNVVAVIIVGTDINGREPNHIDAKLGKMIEFLNNAANIPHPIAGGILEGSRINLINDCVLLVSHGFSFCDCVSAFHYYNINKHRCQSICSKRRMIFRILAS